MPQIFPSDIIALEVIVSIELDILILILGLVFGSCFIGALVGASTELTAIQHELEKRIDFVKNLSAQAKHSEDIISLNESQVDAIDKILSKT